jgi:hypothetical protein
MRTPPPKKSTQRNAAFSKGGETKMFGRGDRTVTAPMDAAGKQTAGRTGQRSKANPRFAKGGDTPMLGEQAADPASPGRTAKPHSTALGGEARPARPGRCAP